MIRVIQSAAVFGISAYPVDIEVDISFGIPQFSIVGLPDQSVKEARERIRAAIKNSGYDFPNEKITINLAPADLKKEGASFDLAMAIGILSALDIIPAEKTTGFAYLGELALDGSIRPVKGSIVITSSLKNHAKVFLPASNAAEGALEKDAVIYPVRHLKEVVQFITGETIIEPFHAKAELEPLDIYPVDFSEVKGQTMAKRALEIAVAGSHNILLIGSPGSGKTMLARRIPSILPPLHYEQAIEITKIYSAGGYLSNGFRMVRQRPFRAPHHSISPVGLTGGGSSPKPGEISLAHHGVLFLDEFGEYRKDVLESLRSPLEDGFISIARAKWHATYPSMITLVAAMNPCPCGFLNDRRRACRCTLAQIQKYKSRISGPILDRIDMHVEVAPIPYQTLSEEISAETSSEIRKRILKCRTIQSLRYGDSSKFNSTMRPADIKRYACVDKNGSRLIELAMKELHLSARAYYKVLKLARTIADLAEKEDIEEEDIAEAIQYRQLDREWRK